MAAASAVGTTMVLQSDPKLREGPPALVPIGERWSATCITQLYKPGSPLPIRTAKLSWLWP
eukprot:2442338-Prymnesium_polylepis.1